MSGTGAPARAGNTPGADGLFPEDRLLLSAPTTKAGQLQRACLKLLRGPRHAESGAIPTSIRFLFYELVQDKVIEKKAKTARGRRPDQDVSDALMHLRLNQLIPWWWIEDETRSLSVWRSAPTIAAYMVDEVEHARITCWRGPAPMILTESRSLAGVLEDIAGEYLCPIGATNGQVGGFLYTDVIPNLVEGQQVLYFGDEDMQGHQIEANTRKVIEAEVAAALGGWERLALTPAQVQQYALPPNPKTDGRYTKNTAKGVSVAYETEALSQVVIQDLLRSRLTALLPEPLADVHVRQDQQRQAVRAGLERLSRRRR